MTEKHAPDPDAEFVPDQPEDPDAPSPRQQTAHFESGRMLAKASRMQLDDPLLSALAKVMAAGGGGTSDVPAGYTYLAQFIAHDLSFERIEVNRQGREVGAPVQKRSPILDLDSLYGSGPGDPSVKYDGAKFVLGTTAGEDGLPALPGFDLPRRAADGAALIADRRNDENLAVAQTHLAFMHFHNAVVETLPDSSNRFKQARALVTTHYQWIVWHDFLPRVCDNKVIADVAKNGRKAFETVRGGRGTLKMPVEFSGAAFRFGHSMLRTNYDWNERMDSGAATLDVLFGLSENGGERTQPIPTGAIADFRRLYDFRSEHKDLLGGDDQPRPNFAMRIDTSLNPRLNGLPKEVITETGRAAPADPRMANLAFRDLRRAKKQQMGTGQRMVTFLRGRKVNVTALSKDDLRNGKNGARITRLKPEQVEKLVTRTPLWFYILREAEVRGDGKLCGVGARIVVEVVHKAIAANTNASIFFKDKNGNAWRPTLVAAGKPFRMTDLLIVAFGESHLKDPLPK
jgi:hypothetical protein